MALSSRSDWFSPLLLLGCLFVIAVAALSGRWGVTFSSPVLADGSQWHVNLRYGTIRVMIGDRESEFTGAPAGLHVETMESWRFEWWFHVAPLGSIRLLQIPMWFPALVLAAWFAMRRARISMRLAAGVCPGCGRAIGGATQCPKCGRQFPRRKRSP